MNLLIFLRQLMADNFYRNPSIVVKDLTLVSPKTGKHMIDINVGQKCVVTSVNRTTGEVTLKWE